LFTFWLGAILVLADKQGRRADKAVRQIGLYPTLDGVTNHKYKLLHFLTTKYFLQSQEGGIGVAI
jgi:hypothetical protein